MLKIYTDGSCLKNPGGPGGWAVCILDSDKEFYLVGSDKSTTNNRMELEAVIEGLSCVKKNQKCIIYTDSKLVINCANGLWKKKSNLDLWLKYENEIIDKSVTFEWVKGHSGDKYNEIVDKLAYQEALSITKKNF